MKILNRFPIVFGTTLLLGVVGCGTDEGPELAVVSGQVLLDDKPLPEAFLEFTPENGSPSYGKTDEDGRYMLRFTRDKYGAMIGKHLVRISTFQEESAEGRRVPERIPAQFNQASQLIREIKPGDNTLDFSLRSQGPIVQPDRDRG